MDGPDCAGCTKVAELTQLVSKLTQRIAELEAKLKTNSSNSSLPPSSDSPQAPRHPPRPPTGRKPGGQPGHPGHTRQRLEPGQIVNHLPSHCRHCQASLSPEWLAHRAQPAWFQVVELASQLVSVTEHQAHGCLCPHCGGITKGEIPHEVLKHGFGPRLTAAIAYLSGRCRGSKRVVLDILQTLLGVPISLGSVINAEQEVSASLSKPYDQARSALQRADVKNVDETGWAEAGKLNWMWLGATSNVAVFNIARGRGQAQLRELLGGDIRGVVCSDRHAAYAIIDPLARQTCWAHLKRDFQKWADWGAQTRGLGHAGLETVKKVFEIWRKFKDGQLDRPGLRAALEPVQKDLREKLELETEPDRPNRKLARFCRRIMGAWPTLWTFVRLPGVEPTNNLAERMLRPAVIWRKISFGNHSQAGCAFTQRILTAVQTLQIQHRPVLAYLHDALAAHRNSQTAPSLLTTGA